MPTKNAARRQFLEPRTVKDFVIAANDLGTKGGGGADAKAERIIRELPHSKRSDLVTIAASWRSRCRIIAGELFLKLKEGQAIDALDELSRGLWSDDYPIVIDDTPRRTKSVPRNMRKLTAKEERLATAHSRAVFEE